MPKDKLSKLNNIYKSINLGDFYNKDYADYAIYRALQRIPNILDGFAQTQRKAIYTCVEKKIEKKINVSDLASLVKTHTKYHHGMGSIEIALTNLVPPYNNQLPLLKEDGTYGCRSEREASASRYIETRLQDYTKILFNQIDNKEFVTDQTTEGHKIEPQTMIPLLPLLLINGQSQIGVGYACDVLPRDITQLIAEVERILKGQKYLHPTDATKNVAAGVFRTDIPPVAPRFKGPIEMIDGTWIFSGIVKEVKKNVFHITEVPPKYTRTNFVKLLNTLKDQDKIKSFSENIVGDDFDIVVKTNPINKVTQEKALDFFKLVERKSENITLINTSNEIVRYSNVAEVLKEYIIAVLGIIGKRKAFILNDLKQKGIENTEKIRFIKAVNDNTLILKKRKKVEVIQDLEKMSFVKIENTYDYLLNMSILSLTDEKITDLEKTIEKHNLEIDTLEKKKSTQLWLDDITKIKKELVKI